MYHSHCLNCPSVSHCHHYIVLVIILLCVGQSSSASAESAGPAARLLADIGWQVASSSPTSSQCDLVNNPSLPLNVSALSARAQDLHHRVKKFIEQHVLPVEQDVMSWHSNPQTKWITHPRIQQLKVTVFFVLLVSTLAKQTLNVLVVKLLLVVIAVLVLVVIVQVLLEI